MSLLPHGNADVQAGEMHASQCNGQRRRQEMSLLPHGNADAQAGEVHLREDDMKCRRYLMAMLVSRQERCITL
jgi:hypothetical protein